MIVAFDTNCLIRWSSRRANDVDRARIEHLLAGLASTSGRVVIPAPSFAEFLVRADAATRDWIDGVTSKRSIVVAPLDRRAALECAMLDRAALGAGDKKAGSSAPWQKIKIDRQIVAIARVANATLLVTADSELGSIARSVGIDVKSISDLEVPASALQRPLAFDGSESAAEKGAALPAARPSADPSPGTA